MLSSNYQLQLKKKVDVYDIYKIMREKNSKRKESYEVLLEKVYKKIQKVSLTKTYTCNYEIPGFIIGYPIYDIKLCIAYIISKLRLSGFVANFINKNIIYISWNPYEIQAQHDKNTVNKKSMLENLVTPGKNINTPNKTNIKKNNTALYVAQQTPLYSQQPQQTQQPQQLQYQNHYHHSQHNIQPQVHQYQPAQQYHPQQNSAFAPPQNIQTAAIIEKQIDHFTNLIDYSDSSFFENTMQTTSIPIHLPSKFLDPIETSKKIEYHPDNLKYDPHNIHLPIYTDNIDTNKQNSNSSPEKKTAVKHPFFGIEKKYNTKGKIILDLT